MQTGSAVTERGTAVDQELYRMLHVRSATEYLWGMGGKGEGEEGMCASGSHHAVDMGVVGR